MIKRNTHYNLDDIEYTIDGKKLVCIQAGITDSNPIVIGGGQITDGEVIWYEVAEGSLVETVCGVHTDGRLIYTKSFNASLTFNDSPNNVVALSSIAQNIDVVLDISGAFIFTSSMNVGHVLVNCNYDDEYYSFLDTWQGYLRHRGGGWTGTWPATITVKYVKKVN